MSTRCLPLLLAAWLGGLLPAAAAPLFFPSFEEVVARSDLVLTGRVSAATPEGGQVAVEQVLKGPKLPATLTVQVYRHNPKGPEFQPLTAGTSYLFCLRQPDAGSEATAIQELDRAACFPLRDGLLCGSWATPRELPAAGLPAATALTLLQGLVQFQAGQVPRQARELLRRQLAADTVTAATAAVPEARPPLLDWLFCAQAAYGEAGGLEAAAAAAAKPALAPWAARALRRVPESAGAFEVVDRLLQSHDPSVQAETVNSVLAANYSRAVSGPLLARALPPRPGPADQAGLLALIRGLTALGYGDSAQEALLKWLDKDVRRQPAVLAALADYFAAVPSGEARERFIELARGATPEAAASIGNYLLQEGNIDAFGAFRQLLQDPQLPGRQKSDWLGRLYVQRGDDGPQVAEVATFYARYPGRVPDWALGLVIVQGQPGDRNTIEDSLQPQPGTPGDWDQLLLLYLLAHDLGPARGEALVRRALKSSPGARGVWLAALLAPTPGTVAALQQALPQVPAAHRPFCQAVLALLNGPAAGGESRAQVDAWLDLVAQEPSPGALILASRRLARIEARSYEVGRLRELIAQRRLPAAAGLRLLRTSGFDLTLDENRELLQLQQAQALALDRPAAEPRGWLHYYLLRRERELAPR